MVSSKSGTPPPGICACANFIKTAVRNKPRYEKTAQGEKVEIINERTRKMVNFLHKAKFSLQNFKFNCLYAPILHLYVTDAIGLRYGRLSFCAKILFYIDQMKVELGRLHLLRSQVCCRSENIKKDMKYVKSLDVKWVVKSHILQAVRAQ